MSVFRAELSPCSDPRAEPSCRACQGRRHPSTTAAAFGSNTAQIQRSCDLLHLGAFHYPFLQRLESDKAKPTAEMSWSGFKKNVRNEREVGAG